MINDRQSINKNAEIANGHLAICGGDKSIPANECGCINVVSLSGQPGLYISQPDQFEQKSLCCTMGSCKKCSSKWYPSSLYRLLFRFSRWINSYRSADN
jgi:hypothetical protein